MAGLANHRRAVVLMALEANTHGRDAGRFGHAFHVLNLSVAHLAFHSCFKMFAMGPIHAGKNLVDAHPGNRLAGF